MLMIIDFIKRYHYSKLNWKKEVEVKRAEIDFSIFVETICTFKIDFDTINIYGREWPD